MRAGNCVAPAAVTHSWLPKRRIRPGLLQPCFVARVPSGGDAEAKQSAATEELASDVESSAARATEKAVKEEPKRDGTPPAPALASTADWGEDQNPEGWDGKREPVSPGPSRGKDFDETVPLTCRL